MGIKTIHFTPIRESSQALTLHERSDIGDVTGGNGRGGTPGGEAGRNSDGVAAPPADGVLGGVTDFAGGRGAATVLGRKDGARSASIVTATFRSWCCASPDHGPPRHGDVSQQSCLLCQRGAKGSWRLVWRDKGSFTQGLSTPTIKKSCFRERRRAGGGG